MKNFKKYICLLLAIVKMTSCMMIVASASSHHRHVNDSTRFSDEWEHTRIYMCTDGDDLRYVGSLVYGYDKGTFSNKDYAWSEGDECNTRAGIKRVGIDDVVQYASWTAKDEYSKKTLTHESYEIYYYIEFYNDYTGKLSGYTNHNTKVNV